MVTLNCGKSGPDRRSSICFKTVMFVKGFHSLGEAGLKLMILSLLRPWIVPLRLLEMRSDMSPKRTRIPMSTVACQDIASIGTWSPEAPGE